MISKSKFKYENSNMCFLLSLFLFLFFYLVEEASIRNSGFLKPNPYVELLIDNKSKRKTDFVKNTYLPKWNEEFTVLVS